MLHLSVQSSGKLGTRASTLTLLRFELSSCVWTIDLADDTSPCEVPRDVGEGLVAAHRDRGCICFGCWKSQTSKAIAQLATFTENVAFLTIFV